MCVGVVGVVVVGTSAHMSLGVLAMCCRCRWWCELVLLLWVLLSVVVGCVLGTMGDLLEIGSKGGMLSDVLLGC